MATVKKTIGRLPVYKGDWVAGSYSMLNQVTYLGSTFQSKIDNNTATPATVVNNALQVNANWSVVSNGTAAYLADSRLTSVESRATQLEQKSVSFADNSFIQSQKPKGLKFKPSDNTVFAKTNNTLNLGIGDFTISLIARAEGNAGVYYPIFGFSKELYSEGSIKIYGSANTNNLVWVLFEKPASGSSNDNSISVSKSDTTTNLHHLVIIRSGNLVKAIVNGRLIKSVTQDKVLNFSNFIFEITNTSYFWGGSVYNYAMTEAEALALWNGGRYDEYVVPLYRKSNCLLEYKPENIRVDRMINTGSAGSAYDLIYSLPTKPTIIYEAPYKDKIVLEDKTTPDFHPIAVGQRCYTSDGKILEAKLPAKGSEWQVSDWKLQ